MFNLGGGLALLAACVLAGELWDTFGPQMTFLVGAGFTALALLGLGFVRWRVPNLGQAEENVVAKQTEVPS